MRQFSAQSAAAHPEQTLVYAKRCENGQSNKFMLRAINEEKPPVDVSYSTFWNDFSHYSLYQAREAGQAPKETPLDYNDLSKFHELFENKERYIDHGDQDGEVHFE